MNGLWKTGGTSSLSEYCTSKQCVEIHAFWVTWFSTNKTVARDVLTAVITEKEKPFSQLKLLKCYMIKLVGHR